MPVDYCEPVYRPPSEADSLLIQATIGCSFAHCTYCVSSVSGKFAVRPLAEIKQSLLEARRMYGSYVRKVFLLSQNALMMSATHLAELSRLAYELFPGLERVSLYGHPLDLIKKTPEELRAIFDSGITLLYVGLESGNDEVLRQVKKHTTAEKSILGCRKAIDAGLKLSCTVIVGLGGKKLSREHAQDTGRLISAISPHYLGCLTLMVNPGSEMERSIREGTFEPLTAGEILDEFQVLLENIGPLKRTCIFRANHASNYLSLAGDLPQDRERLIREVMAAKHRPERLRSEMWRRL